ncbi:MAG: IS1595 family transposase, partial [Flavobacteriaceae bacterium]|nr:IS1595 family transposase [Flavobacteriaceae bacterium]
SINNYAKIISAFAKKPQNMDQRDRDGNIKTEAILDTTQSTIHTFISENVAQGSHVYTDEHRSYKGLKGYSHYTVNHSIGEYVNGNIHTNGIESFWAILKRGYYGIYHHFSWKHLHRYLSEFEIRWAMIDLNECDRLNSLLESTSGCRLTYKRLIS